MTAPAANSAGYSSSLRVRLAASVDGNRDEDAGQWAPTIDEPAKQNWCRKPMDHNMSKLHVLSCLDSEQMAAARRQELNIPREVAAALGRSAVKASRNGFYLTKDGQEVVWRDAVRAACAAKRSIAPNAALPRSESSPFMQTRVQVTNETTLGASRRLVEYGRRPFALNFANGIQPGGGFLSGARAQEEVLCRSSAVYQTLFDDPMYEEHRKRP